MGDRGARQRILLVDDTPQNIHVLGGVLDQLYRIQVAVNGETALAVAKGEPRPDLILLDIMMPGIDGYEVCRRLKADPATSDIPVIFITALDASSNEERGFAVGGVDYITKPIVPATVLARVKTHLALYDQQRELAQEVNRRTEELVQTRLKIIQRLGRAAEFKDNETGLHVIRMSHYARLIAESYGGNEQWVAKIFHAAPMHDVGKIGIPDQILLKPGKLDPNEWALMQKHVEFGAEIIGPDRDPLLQISRSIALTHHEKWDGSGYPSGLQGEEIPLEGRIVALADVFDALTSERPYKKAWEVEAAVKFIEANAGSHFDPDLVPLFRQVLPEMLHLKDHYADEHGPVPGLNPER